MRTRQDGGAVEVAVIDPGAGFRPEVANNQGGRGASVCFTLPRADAAAPKAAAPIAEHEVGV